MVFIIKAIYGHLKIKNYDGKIHITLFLALTLILGWIIYVATATLNYYDSMFIVSIKRVLSLSFLEERTLDFFTRQFLDYSTYELFVRRFIYIPLILMLSSIGFYYLLTKKNFRNEYVLALSLYSSLFIISLFGTITSAMEFGRFLTFGFISVAFLIGVSMDQMNKNPFLKMASLIAVILLLIGSASVGTNPPHRSAYSENIRIGQQTITLDVITAANWSEQYLGRYNTMVSNTAVSNVFDFYGIQKSGSYGGWEVFFPQNVSSGVVDYLTTNNISYLVVDGRISRFTSETLYYFELKELKIENHPPYGNTEPLPEVSLSKFNEYPAFMKIYNNGNIKIYKNYLF